MDSELIHPFDLIVSSGTAFVDHWISPSMTMPVLPNDLSDGFRMEIWYPAATLSYLSNQVDIYVNSTLLSRFTEPAAKTFRLDVTREQLIGAESVTIKSSAHMLPEPNDQRTRGVMLKVFRAL